MGFHLEFAAVLMQLVFLGLFLSVVGFYMNRAIKNWQNSRASLTKAPKLSHADAARARIAARNKAGSSSASALTF